MSEEKGTLCEIRECGEECGERRRYCDRDVCVYPNKKNSKSTTVCLCCKVACRIVRVHRVIVTEGCICCGIQFQLVPVYPCQYLLVKSMYVNFINP